MCLEGHEVHDLQVGQPDLGEDVDVDGRHAGALCGVTPLPPEIQLYYATTLWTGKVERKS